MNKGILKLVIIIIGLLIPLSLAFASNNNLLAQVELRKDLKPSYAVSITPEKGTSTAAIANIVLQLIAGSLIYAAGPIAIFMIALGGLRYVVSHGDQTQMEEAKKTITWAVVGLAIIIVSWAAVTAVINIFEAIPK